MGRVINFFSHRKNEDIRNVTSNNSLDSASAPEKNSRLITYDPQMPVATEMFIGLDKSALLDGCWVPFSWDENGIVVLVEDPSKTEKQAAIKALLKTDRIIFAVGIKEDIEAYINRSFSQIEMDNYLSNAMSGEEPIDVTKLIEIIITEAYIKGAAEIYFEWSEFNSENRVSFRMGGEYQEYMTVAEAVVYDVVKKIKSMADLAIYDREHPKVGHLKFSNNDVPEFKIAVTIYPIDGLREDVVLRILTTGDHF